MNGDEDIGDVTIVIESFAPLELWLVETTVVTFVVFACFRMQSSLQYTEFTRDAFVPQTIQFGTVEFAVDCGTAVLDDDGPASLILTDEPSVTPLRGKIF